MLTNLSFAATTCTTAACKKLNKKYYRHRSEPAQKEKIVLSPVTVAASNTNQNKTAIFSMSNISGEFDLTSNYMDRGISQTQNLPAIQGGLTYSFPIGLYFNAWGSNVKFIDPKRSEATVEVDTIGGWRGSFWNNNISYDINFDRYNYPQARSANYNELNTLWTYKILQVGISYSANAYNFHKSGTYYNGTLTFGIPPRYVFNLTDVNFQIETGHYSLCRAAGNSYNDYSLTLNKKINSTFIITAQWTNTNGRQHFAPYDSSQLLGMITAVF